jgi:3',5'-cyclic AMP phosphodiesterase CpdA
MLRLAHLSDIHFGGEDKAATEAAIDACAAFSPDLVVITGDLTLNGLPREFEAARAWLARLPPPYLVTPGNHDTPYWNIPLRALAPFNRYRRYIGEPDHVFFEKPGLSVHALNSARGAPTAPGLVPGRGESG